MPTVLPGSAAAESNYSRGLTLIAETSKPISQFAGKDKSNLIVTEMRDGTQRGSTITCRYSGKLDATQRPKVMGEPVIGHERDTQIYTHSINLEYFKDAVHVEHIKVEPEMVSYDVKKPKLFELARLFADWFENCYVYHMAGHATTAINAAPDYALSGGNPVVAYNSENIVYVQGSGATNASDADCAADTDAILTTEWIDEVRRKMQDPRSGLAYPIVPASTPYGPLYVLACSPIGFSQIRSSAASTEFRPIVHSMLQGGADYDGSPFRNFQAFVYGDTLVFEQPNMPTGLTAGAEQANSRVAVFGGAGLLTRAFGDFTADGDHLNYDEHVVLSRLTMQAETLVGINRTIVNNKTWAGIRLVHYSKDA